MKAIILAGGFGARLSSVVSDLPKPMAVVAGKPFLEYLIIKLRKSGLNEIILSVGYKADIIKSYFGNGAEFGVNIEYCFEESPLGTAGALKKAFGMIKEDVSLALNGDSYSAVDFKELISANARKKALATIALVNVKENIRYGSVEISDNSEITKFVEKKQGRGVLINAGVYCLDKRIFDIIAPGKVSVEQDLFPRLIGRGIYGFVFDGPFIDIGVPDAYLSLCHHPELLY